MFPGRAIIGPGTNSFVHMRGSYTMPSDEILRWPRNRKTFLNLGRLTSAPLTTIRPLPGVQGTKRCGSSSRKTTGFQVRTSGLVGHIFPHWNWKPGEKIDVVAYFNNADEVELSLNGRSQGTKRKQGDEMRVFWRLVFEPGLLKAVSRKSGQVVLSREVRTAGTSGEGCFDSFSAAPLCVFAASAGNDGLNAEKAEIYRGPLRNESDLRLFAKLPRATHACWCTAPYYFTSCSSSSGVRGQSSFNRRERARSARSFPPVWHVGQ